MMARESKDDAPEAKKAAETFSRRVAERAVARVAYDRDCRHDPGRHRLDPPLVRGRVARMNRSGCVTPHVASLHPGYKTPEL